MNYKDPTKRNEIKCIVTEYYPDMWIVTDCIKNWLKVKAIINGKNMRVGFRQICNAAMYIPPVLKRCFRRFKS